jgi:pimeloyl-ACP methyl ester carboxylesterase
MATGIPGNDAGVTDNAGLSTDLVVHRHGRPPGPGVPTLFLLHGLTDSGEGWPEGVRHWQDDHAIVMPDQRGHGRSPRFTEDELERHPGDVLVEDAIHLLEQLERPVVIGHSLGGAVALVAAVRRPELVRALVLEDPAPRGPHEPQASGRGREFAAGVEQSIAAPDEEALYRLRKELHPDWPDSELLVTGLAEQQMHLEFLERGDYKPTTPWTQLFAAVTVPTLVVSGDRVDEIVVGQEMEEGIAEIGNPHVSLMRVAGAGHCIRREQPEEYYRTVDGWLAGIGT